MTDARTISADIQDQLRALQRRLGELEQTEADLRKVQAIFASAFDHSPLAIWISDDKGTLIQLNQACRDLLQTTDEELVGKYNLLEDNVVQAQGHLALVQSVFEQGQQARFVIEYNASAANGLRRPAFSQAATEAPTVKETCAQATPTSGSNGPMCRRPAPVVLDVNISPVKDASGRVCNAVVHLDDLTERTRAQLALEQSRQAEHRLAQRLTALHEISNLLTQASSFDELCRQAVVLGRERLGFERLGIWFLEEDQRHIRGSFGTDEQGQLRDERGCRVPLAPRVAEELASGQRIAVIRHDRSELHDPAGRVVGQGPLAWTPIWDGHKNIGLLYADGLLRDTPFNDQDCEVLALYGAALGHLCVRQWAEEALRANEARMHSIFRAAPIGIGVVVNRILKEVNDRLCEMTGYSRQELLGQSARMLYLSDQEYDRVGREKYEQISQCGIGTIETRWKHKDGHIIDILLSSSPLAPHDLSLGVTFTALDITARKCLEHDLRFHQDELRAILESTADGILAVDERGRVIHANRRFAELWRIPAGLIETHDDNQLLNYVLAQLAEPDAFLAKVRQLYRSHEVSFDTLLFKDGRFFERFSCPLIREGRLAGRVWSFRDVTERRQAEQARRESEQRLRQVVESLPIILYSVEGGTNRFLLVKGAVQEMLGYSPEFLMNAGDVSGQFVHPEDKAYVAAAFKAGLETRRPFEVEYRVVHGQDGRSVWVRECVVPMVGPDGAIIRQDGIVLDVTEQKQAEAEHERMRAELLQAQKLQSIGVLAGGIAHDFNNLLTVISGNAQILARKLSLDPTCAELLKDIETAATHATEMTQSLQAFSRPAKPRIRLSDANTLVNEAYRLLRRLIPATIDFQLDLETTPCTIAADPGQIQQILVNLCVNSRDAMPSGGRLTIQTRRVGPEALPLSARRDAEHEHYLRLRVTDTGCGMDDITLSRVFDPFFTTKPMDRGTGLGLAIVYRIVQSHGGAISVASRPGAGTSFDLFFPVSQAPPEPLPVCEASAACGEEHILVVEDEEMVGSLLRTVLEGRGYTVRLAGHPEEALRLVHAAEKPFDLAVIDYALPAMTGDRLLAELRQVHPSLKAILITGGNIDDDTLAGSDCRLMRKPFAVPAMVQAVRQALDES